MENEERERLFKQKILAHQQYITRFLMTICKDPTLTEDILQDVLVHAWMKFDMILAIKGDMGHYLCSMAKNMLMNHYRWKRRHCKEEWMENPGEDELAPDDVLQEILDKEERRELLMLVSQIRKEHAQVLLLYYYFDFPLQTVAKMLGVNYNTALSWNLRGRKALLALLQEARERGDDRYGTLLERFRDGSGFDGSDGA